MSVRKPSNWHPLPVLGVRRCASLAVGAAHCVHARQIHAVLNRDGGAYIVLAALTSSACPASVSLPLLLVVYGLLAPASTLLGVAQHARGGSVRRPLFGLVAHAVCSIRATSAQRVAHWPRGSVLHAATIAFCSWDRMLATSESAPTGRPGKHRSLSRARLGSARRAVRRLPAYTILAAGLAGTLLPGSSLVRRCFVCAGPGAGGISACALRAASAAFMSLGLGHLGLDAEWAEGGTCMFARAVLLATSEGGQAAVLLRHPDAHALSHWTRYGLACACGGCAVQTIAAATSICWEFGHPRGP